MDLLYPSQKDQQLSKHISAGIRKPSLVLKDSLRNIPALPPLPPSLKKNIEQLLRNDYPYELNQIIERQVVSLRVEVGRKDSQQNLLHVACRQNAQHCVQYLLKRYHTHFPSEYEFWVNLGNKERMTPAMLCSLTGANESLKILLDYGGIDIHLIDSNKLSAYQIALASKNQTAVKLLMEYQGSKKGQKIDKQKLNQEVELVPGKISLCESLYRCLMDCFRGGVEECDKEEKMKKVRSKKGGSMLDVVSGGIENYFKDRVELGYSKDTIKSDEVQWRSLGEYQQLGSNGVLFDTFSPFDIEDLSFSMQSVLICFQSLSQHPWLLRRIIQINKTKSSHYLVTFYPKHQSKTFTVDGSLPFHSGNNQPLFIGDKKEGWPMLLQKSLARHYGSYKSLSEVGPSDLILTLTGWPVFRLPIINGSQTMQLLQQITSLGYMFILEGRDTSYLSCPKKHNCSFTVLTFYTKGDKRLVLINCPFVDPAWVEKERHQILALKILRGHYNCRQQMTIWVEQERLKEYFSHLVVAPIKTGHHRHNLHLNAIQWLYFRVEIGQNQDDSVILHLVDSQKGTIVDINKAQGWLNQKQKVTFLPAEKLREQMIEFQGQVGEYLFRVKVEKGKYQLIGWADEEIKLEAVQESFGQLQWIACLKKNLSLNWKEQDPFAVCNTGDYTLLMKKSEGNCWASGFGNVQVIEGKKGNQGIEMLSFDEDFRFCVVRGTIKSVNFYET